MFKISGQKYFNEIQSSSNLKKDAIRGAGFTVFSQLANQGIQIVSTIILARILDPEDFGLVAMVVSVFLFFKMFRSGGLLDATIQKEKISHSQISTLFWINLGLGCGLTVIFIALSPVLSLFYKDPRIRNIAILISIDFVLAGLSAQHRALLKRNFEFHKTTAIEIIATSLSFATAIALALRGMGYWALVARHVIYPVFEAIGAWTFCRWRPGLPVRGSGVRPMVKFGAHMLGNYSIGYFSQNLDKILLGWRYGAQATGYYSRAYYLFMAPAQQLTYPMTGVAVATLSRLCNDPDKFRRYYMKSIMIIAFIGFPLSAILTVLGNDFILLLLGPKWKIAAEIFSIFGLGIGLQMLHSTNAWIHISLGNTDRWLRSNIVCTIVTVVAFIIGLQYGAKGIAVGYIISLFILVGPVLSYAGKPIQLKISFILLEVWKNVLSSIISGLISWYILFSFSYTSNMYTNLNIVNRLIVGSIICISIYIALLIILSGGIEPIKRFVSVFKEFVPRKNANRNT